MSETNQDVPAGYYNWMEGVDPIYDPQKEASQEMMQPFEEYPELLEWAKYMTAEPETGLQKTGRLTSKVTKEFLAGAAGVPGDISHLIESGVAKGADWLAQRAGGEKGELEQQLLEGFQTTRDIAGPGRAFPGSQEISKELAPAVYGGDEPRSEFEQSLSNVAQDTGSLASGTMLGLPAPGQLERTASQQLGRSAMIATGGEAAARGTEAFGGGPEAQRNARIGTYVMSGLIRPGATRRFVNGLWEDVRATLPKNAKAPTQELYKNLDSIEATISKGLDPRSPQIKEAGLAPTKRKLTAVIDNIRQKGQGDLIPVDELLSFKTDVGQIVGDAIAEAGSTAEIRGLERYFMGINKSIDDAINLYGKNSSPEWLQTYRNANQGYRGLAQSQSVSRQILGTGKKAKISPETLAIYALAYPKPAGAIAGLKATAGTMASLDQVLANPTLRKYYWNTVQAAAQNNSAAMVSNMKKLDKALQKQRKEDAARKKRLSIGMA